MRIIRNVRSSTKQNLEKAYGNELHLMMGERTVDVEGVAQYEYDEIIVDDYTSYSDVNSSALEFYKATITPELTFVELQTAKIKQLHDNYSEFYNSYTNSYSTLEVESFKDKADEAKAYMRDNTAPTPYVDAMVGGDPLARVEILNAIWAKVAYLASVEGQVIAKRDAIKATTTQEELDLIDITFGA